MRPGLGAPGVPQQAEKRCRRDRGAVTVEAALALCALVVFLAAATAVLATMMSAIRCVDAARELARLAARGEEDRGREVAALLAPDGAVLDLRPQGDLLVVEVTAPAAGPLPLRVGGRAVAAREPPASDP